MCLLIMGVAALGTAPSRTLAAPDGRERVDLKRAIALALAQNPELSAARHEIGVARAQRDRVASERWPAVRGLAFFTENRRNQRLYPAASPGEPAIVSHHLFGADLFVSLPLFTGGRLRANLRAADHGVSGTRQAETRSKTEVIYKVTSLYFAILAQRQLCGALQTSEEVLRAQQKKLAALVEERKAAPLDRQRVEVRLAALRQRRIRETSTLDALTLSLVSLMGLDGQRPVEVAGTLTAPKGALTSRSEDAIATALKRRPDYLAARASLRALEERVIAARAGHWPQLSLQGSYGIRWGIAPSEAPAGVSTVADVGQVGLLLDVPIFLGGKVRAEIREQEARLRAAADRLRQLELRIRVEVQTALLDRDSAVERVAVSETTIALAKEAYRVEAEKHAAGKSTITDLLSTQADLLDAEAERARALADSQIARAALTLALGETP
jgi:outer membrane protein TolC